MPRWRDVTPAVRDAARELRRRMTPAEAALWEHLRERRADGRKWRRQHALSGHVADFCCVDARLIVEVDGNSHLGREAEDAERSRDFADRGFRVVRFRNEQVLADLAAVLAMIDAEVGLALTPGPSPAAAGDGRLPQRGGAARNDSPRPPRRARGRG